MHQALDKRESMIQRRADKLVFAGIVIVILAVFALYLRTLDRQSLWFDEGLSVIFAGRALPDLMRTLIYEDLHPPLYYLLLHFWMILAGNSEWAVRMPSALAAVLLVPLAFAVVGEVWSDGNGMKGIRASVGIAAAALVGSSPFIAFYAQETRMYSLAAVLALGATWAFLKAARTDALRWWLMFSVLMTASLYTQYFSAFIVPAFWLWALVLRHQSLVRTVLSTSLAALLYLPWVRPAYLQIARLLQTPDYWVTTRIDPGLFLRAMLNTFLPSATVRLGLLLALVGVAFILRLLQIRGLKLSERARRSVLVFLTFSIPLVLTYAAVSVAPKFAARYAIAAAAPLYVCAALALYAALGHGSAVKRAIVGVLILAALVISVRSTLAVVEGRDQPRDDARGLAAYLTDSVRANDALLLVEDAPYALQYYYQGTAPWYGLHVGQSFANAADVLNRILQTKPRRLWLILWHREFADPSDMVVTELMRVGREVTVSAEFLGYELRAFDIQDYDETIEGLPQPEHAMDAHFWPGIQFLGFDRLSHNDGRLHYVLYWQAQQTLERNYSSTLSFVDRDGNEYLRQDQALSTPHFLPPVWPVHEPIRGRVDMELPADLPPLSFRVYLRVLDPETGHNLDIIDENDIPLGQALLLEELALPKSAMGQGSFEVKNLVQADMGDNLQLLGFDLARLEYRPGETVSLTLWWLRSGAPSVSPTPGAFAEEPWARVRLLDTGGASVWEGERPVVPGYPLSEWVLGEVNRTIYRLMIPSNLPGGEYRLQAGVSSRLVSLTSLDIAPRQHQYEMPVMQQSLGIRFEQGITLLGCDLQAPAVQPGEAITATLYWQTQKPITTSLKVSVQLLTTDPKIAAQDDSVPARWTYPTTAWLPGEIVTDEHVLAIPPEAVPGYHTLIAVLYDEQTASRLRVERAGKTSDHAVLTVLRMTPRRVSRP